MGVLAVAVLGCTKPDKDPPPDHTTPTPTKITTTPGGPALVGNPALSTPDAAPLARSLAIETTTETRLALDVDDGLHPFHVAFPELATRHEVPVLGLDTDVDVAITAHLTDEGDRELVVHLAPFHTVPLPTGFPTVEVLSLDPARVEPGFRLITLQLSDNPYTLVAMRADGSVGWVYTGTIDWGDARVTAQGTVLGLDIGAWEMDLLGNTLRHWDHKPGAGDLPLPWGKLSHELYPLDDGTFASLAYADYTSPAYPVSYDPPTPEGPAKLITDRVVRFDRDGNSLADWNLGDLLDTSRIGFDSLDLTTSGFDWSHANAIVPYGDGLLVEVRHQDALVELGPTGQIEWILGDPAGWPSEFAPLLLQPVGDLTWPYHPHGPSIDDQGRILLFDNHNEGHTPYTPDPGLVPESRVAAFEVDPAARTVRQAWEWKAPQVLYSAALGDARFLPRTGNVLGAWSFLEGEGDVLNVDRGLGEKSIRLIEFRPDEAEPVSDLRLTEPASVYPGGVKAYRAIPVESLYAEDVVVTPLP